MTNILIPTDFAPASLKLAESIARAEGYNKCNLILFHAFELPDSPFDLLGTSRRDPSCELMTEGFRQACKHLKDSNPGIFGKIIVRCLQGNTRNLFRNFIDANDIDLIYCPDDYRFVKVHARSLDPLPFFRKCGVPVVKRLERRLEETYRRASFAATTPQTTSS